MGAPERKLLIEHSAPLALQIVEDKSGGKLRAKGIFGVVGEATKNGRRYGRKLWEKEIARLREAVSSRKMAGELDHPDDGKSKLSRASHLITALRIVPDGDGRETVEGELEVLGTSRGKDLAALIEGGVQVGVSSRGFGSTKPRDDGTEDVQEDYKLVTFDVVADPAAPSAYPTFVTEEVEFLSVDDALPEGAAGLPGGESKIDPVDLASLRARYPELMTQLERTAVSEHVETVRKTMAAELVEALRTYRTEALEKAREEISSDPENARAKDVVGQIAALAFSVVGDVTMSEAVEKLQAERDRALSELSAAKAALDERAAQDEQVAARLEEAALALHLEKRLHGVKDLKAAREYVGDLSACRTVADLDTKLEGYVRIAGKLSEDGLSKTDETALLEAKRETADVKHRMDASARELAEVKAELRNVRAEASEAKDVVRKTLLRLYVERKIVETLSREPRVDAERLRTVLQEGSTTEAVDRLLDAYRTRVVSLLPRVEAAGGELLSQRIRAKMRRSSTGDGESGREVHLTEGAGGPSPVVEVFGETIEAILTEAERSAG